MKIFRKGVVRILFSVGTFVVLVNMVCVQLAFSFCVNDIHQKNSSLKEIFSYMYNLSEEDVGNEKGEEGKEAGETKEIDFLISPIQLSIGRTTIFYKQKFFHVKENKPVSGILQIVAQPPEIA